MDTAYIKRHPKNNFPTFKMCKTYLWKIGNRVSFNKNVVYCLNVGFEMIE